MKFKNIVNMSQNSNNKQISFNLKKKELKKFGITPESLLELNIPKPNVDFYKKQKGVKNGIY